MFFRFLIWTLVFYLLARFIWRIVQSMLGPPRSGPEKPTWNEDQAAKKQKEEFQDVRDAKFIDVPKSPSEESSTGSE